MVPICTNCGRVIAPGGAKGLCGRCWKYQRRNGTLPSPALARRGGFTAALTLNLTPELLRELKAIARTEKTTPRELARAALQELVAKRLRRS